MKTRDEREAELIGLIQTQSGRDQLHELYRKAARIPAGKVPAVGISWREHMIPAILNAEYPQKKP